MKQATASNVVSISAAPALEPDTELVELLEGLLERAKRGDIVAVAIGYQAGACAAGSIYHVGKHGDVAHLLLGLECVKLRLLAPLALDDG